MGDVCTSGEDRPRFSEAEVREHLRDTKSSMVEHLLDNGDGTFSVMAHIVCEHCDYCTSQGDCRGEPDIEAVPYKENPYEEQEKMDREWDLERQIQRM